MRSRIAIVAAATLAIGGCAIPTPTLFPSAPPDEARGSPAPSAISRPAVPSAAPATAAPASASRPPTALPAASPSATAPAGPQPTPDPTRTPARTPAPTPQPRAGFAWTSKSRASGIPIYADPEIVATRRGFVLWTTDSLHHSADLRTAVPARTGDVDLDQALLRGVAFGDDRAVAVGELSFEDPATGEEVNEPLLLISPDGRSWEHYRDPGLGRGGLEAVAWVNGTFVMTGWLEGEGPAVWVSPDAMYLERLPGDAATRIAAGLVLLVSDREELLAFVRTGDPYEAPTGMEVWRTTDGRAWQRAGQLPRSAGAYRIAAVRGNGTWFAGIHSTERGRAVGWVSSDGLTWTRTKAPMHMSQLGDIVGYKGGFIATGWYGEEPGVTCGSGAPYIGQTWTSADGRTWHELPRTRGVAMTSLAVRGDRLVGLGISDHDGKTRRWSGRLPGSLAAQSPQATGRLPVATGGCGP